MIRKWFHLHYEDSLSGEHYLVGVQALNEEHAKLIAPSEVEHYFEPMFQVFLGFMSEDEAECSGLDEF